MFLLLFRQLRVLNLASADSNLLSLIIQMAESIAECVLNLASADSNLLSLIIQTAESIAECVLNLASADSNLAMAAESSLLNLSGSDTNVMVTLDAAEASSSQATAVVIHDNATSQLPPPASPTPQNMKNSAGNTAAIVTSQLLAAASARQRDSDDIHDIPQGSNRGMVTPEELLEEKDVFEPVIPPTLTKTKNDNNNSDSQHSRPTTSNPMSVSVPNLTSSMEQTVSLLESFAAVARRNLGNNANNMARSAHASSLVRLALASNSPGMSNTFIYIHLRNSIYIILYITILCYFTQLKETATYSYQNHHL